MNSRWAFASLAGIALLVIGSSGASAAATAVPLGTAKSFVVLAGSGVTATGPNTLNGDLGTFPTTTVTGLGTITVNGTDHGGDGVTQGAKSDLVNAYNNAAGQGPTMPIVANLGGQTLVPGVYNQAATMLLTGVLTLDAQGDPAAVWVFQAGSDLTVMSGSSVSLVNGAQSCNVFWQVTSSAGLGTNSHFRGTIIALTSITLDTGATLTGRALARNGDVTLDNNTITRPSCTSAGSGGLGTGDGSTAGSATTGNGLAFVLGVVGVGAGTLGVLYGLRRRQGSDA
jgi:hypothetical protein